MNLSQWMLNAYRRLGKLKKGDEFLATGGSTSTIINTNIATRPEPYDPDYGIGFTAFVVRDGGGASAAPENEFAEVTAYADNTNTFSFAASSFTAAVASGDKIALVNDDIPYLTMMELANTCLKDLGRIELVDTSLTTASNQTEYTLPLAAKYSVRRVEVQNITSDSNDNQYTKIYERDITPAAPGSTGLLTLPQLASGYQIKLWYEGIHPTLTAYSSYVSETIDEDVAIKGLMAYALQWYNNTRGGGDEYWLKREIDAWNIYNGALAERPIKKSNRVPKFFVKGKPIRRGDQLDARNVG